MMPTTKETTQTNADAEMLTRYWTNTVSDLLIDLHEVQKRLHEAGEDGFQDAVPLVDRSLSRSYADAAAMARLAHVLAPARYDRADVLTELRRWSPSNVRTANARQDGRSAPQLMCDIKQVIACLEMICGTVDRQSAGGFRLDWLREEAAPGIIVQASRGAQFAGSVSVTDSLRITWERLRDCWTAATNGGDINRPSIETLVLTFRGNRTVSAGEPKYERVRVAMLAIVFALRPWQGAYGAADTGYMAASEGLRLYSKQVQDAIASAEAVHELLESNPTAT